MYKKTISIAMLLVSLCVAAFPVAAQEKFKIAGGGGIKNKSVYSSMLETLSGRCSTDAYELAEVNTKGGTENLAKLKGNEVKAALIPADVLASARLDNATSVANLKTLFVLHNEAAHLIARGDVKKEGQKDLGVLGKWGGTEVQFNTAEDLKGRTIGAVGGSARTAQILSDILKYQWKVKDDYADTNALLAALQAGQIDAILISAGIQSDAVKAIKGNFKLLQLRGNTDTANVYGAVKVEYANLNGGRAVDTLAARAYFMTRVFRSEEQIKMLSELRACFFREVPKIQDADGTHPAWQDVNLEERGDPRFWYDLPTAKAAPAATPKKK